jgi:hypothetical protein
MNLIFSPKRGPMNTQIDFRKSKRFEHKSTVMLGEELGRDSYCNAEPNADNWFSYLKTEDEGRGGISNARRDHNDS